MPRHPCRTVGDVPAVTDARFERLRAVRVVVSFAHMPPVSPVPVIGPVAVIAMVAPLPNQ